MIASAFAVVAPLALAGCSSVANGSPTGTKPSGAVAVDCGRVELGQGGPAVPADKLTCFEDGAKTGARTTLTVVMPTTEGDPIVTTYRTSGPGEVEVVVDSTADKFAGSGGGISTQRCRYLVTRTEIQVRACTDPRPA
jgi:hypothetical protein